VLQQLNRHSSPKPTIFGWKTAVVHPYPSLPRFTSCCGRARGRRGPGRGPWCRLRVVGRWERGVRGGDVEWTRERVGSSRWTESHGRRRRRGPVPKDGKSDAHALHPSAAAGRGAQGPGRACWARAAPRAGANRRKVGAIRAPTSSSARAARVLGPTPPSRPVEGGEIQRSPPPGGCDAGGVGGASDSRSHTTNFPHSLSRAMEVHVTVARTEATPIEARTTVFCEAWVARDTVSIQTKAERNIVDAGRGGEGEEGKM
jgi:hypothetical protein